MQLADYNNCSKVKKKKKSSAANSRDFYTWNYQIFQIPGFLHVDVIKMIERIQQLSWGRIEWVCVESKITTSN